MRQLTAYLMCAVVVVAIVFSFSPRDPQTPVDTHLRSQRLQINGLLNLEKRQVAVGERGTILLSDDQGASWHEALVEPQRHITLTALTAMSTERLVAVGHDGWILHSEDAGSTWQEARYDSESGEPLLGLWSVNDKRVVAFGSFGKFYQSSDAGQTWQSLPLEVDSAHINSMDGGEDGRRMLVGEQGLVLRTSDDGQHWQPLPPFYKGSLFGVVRLTADRWVTYGMRGHVFVSDDFGNTWKPVETGQKLPLYGHARLPGNAGLLIVGAAGSVVRLDERGRYVSAERLKGLGTLTSAIVLNEQKLLVGGEQGLSQGSNGGSIAALTKQGASNEAR